MWFQAYVVQTLLAVASAHALVAPAIRGRQSLGIEARGKTDPGRSSKDGSVDVDGHRARSGIIAYDKDGLIVMVSAPREDKETKTVTLDWIFPRGGIDTRMDGWDPSKPEPHFRAAAIREADEEAGVLFPGDFKPDDLRLLTHTENGAEYWFSGPVGSLKDSWKEEGPNKHRGHFTVDEAENMLRSAKKFQKTMLKALREYRDGASSSGSGGH